MVEENRKVDGRNGRCLLKIDLMDEGDADVEGGHGRVIEKAKVNSNAPVDR